MKNLISIVVLVSLTCVLLAEGNGEGGYGSAMEIQLDQTVSGHLASTYQEDFYKFDLDRTGTLEVKMMEVPANAQTEMVLSSEHGSILPVMASGSVPGELVTLKADITQPDLYYLLIRNQVEGDLAETDYAFVVSLSR